MNSVRSNCLSLKYQGFPTSGCQDIGSRQFEFVAKTQFLWLISMITILANVQGKDYATVKNRFD